MRKTEFQGQLKKNTRFQSSKVNEYLFISFNF